MPKVCYSLPTVSYYGKDNILLEPYNYLAENPGKNVRTKLMEAFNEWLQVPFEKLKIITDAIEMLHNASLLIDDIQDGSTLRRGNPVAHLVYGTPSTINCSNYVYFLALQKLLELKEPAVIRIYTEELCNLHRGQGMDLFWRDNNVCPTETDYLEMISNKTGGLLRLAVKIMQICGTVKTDLVPFVDKFGLYFQVRDDYVNLQSDQFMKEKGSCEDLSEGKFSFPVIHSVRQGYNAEIMEVLKLKTQDHEILRAAVESIKKAGSLEYTLTFVIQLERETRDEIYNLGGSPRLTKIVDALAQIYASAKEE